MAKVDATVTTERNPRKRDPEDRSQPFLSVLLSGLLLVPAFGGLLRFIVFWSPEMKNLIGYFCVVMGFVLAAFTMAVNARVAKRDQLIAWHYAVTWIAFGSVLYGTVNVRWPAETAPWWDRLLAVVDWPAWWVVCHLFGSLIIALSWLLYRFDNLRSSTTNDDDRSGLAKLVKWPTGAKVRSETIEADEFAITAKVDHPGVPVAELRNAVAAIEENPAFVRGRASVIGGDRGGSSTVRLVHTDPHKEWRKWPGLSHPGGYFHEPLRTCYYSTGETQWYSFVRTPDGYRSRVAPKFRAENGTFIGAQGMTGAGKSGEAAIEIAEVASRRDVISVYADPATLLATCGWCIDFAELVAGSPATTGYLFSGLRRVGEYRQRVLGEINARDFTPEVARKTGLSWIYLFFDEFDVAKQGADMAWLATKARKLGFRFKFTLPRATGDNLDTNIRAAVGAWRQFGINQDYDSGFVVSKETLAAGANPEAFGATKPGVNFFDQAPGIDPTMYAIDCRAYRTNEDFSDLRAAVLAARATFEPARFTPGELEALGDVATVCSPRAVLTGEIVTAKNSAGKSAAATDMQVTQNVAALTTGDDDDVRNVAALDPETRAMLDDLPSADVSDLEREFGKDNIDPRRAIPVDPPDSFTLTPQKPKASREEQLAEFDAALIRMAGRGVREFTPKDVRAEMRVDMRDTRVSERFTAIQEDESINPPGLKVERLGGGKYLLVRLQQHGR